MRDLNVGTVVAPNGEGRVPRDYAEAVKWYRQAAEQGFADAQNDLGVAYNHGEGVPRDDVEAYMWLSLAAVQGIVNARKNLDLVETRLTPEQRAEAQKMARERHPVAPAHVNTPQ